MKIIKLALVTLLSAAVLFVPSVAMAGNIAGNLCEGANVGTVSENATTEGCKDTQGSSVADLAEKIINIFSWIVGLISVIMIIYGGFKYITSSGNDANVTSAKNTILYAIIGLVIVALSQIIVRFVISRVTNTVQ